MSHSCDLFIVGAGPAGMSAAIIAARAGLSVVVADEGGAPGGQIYRGVQGGTLAALGADYHEGRALADAFIASSARYLPRSAVFMIESQHTGGFDIGVSCQGQATLWQSARVLIATGALERPFPIPGWTLPGVMTAGAAQTLLKSSAIVPHGPTILAGSGPLLLLLAAQYRRLGVPIAALLDTTPGGQWRAALPHLPGFLASAYFGKGLALLRELAGSVKIMRGVTALAAIGNETLNAVDYTADGQTHRLPAATLLLHQGVVPQVNLAMAAGVEHRWNARRLAFEPVLDADGRSNIADLFIAGDTGGIGGAAAAARQGQIAALAMLGANAEEPRAALKAALRGRAFLDALYRPALQFRLPADDVIVCRCEEVTAGDIRALAHRGTTGPNQAKVFTRAGMGPCQGRGCALTVCELIAAERGQSPQTTGHMRVRNPVKPIALGEMASLTRSAAPQSD
ncbi:MAG: FAD-dependent oxidoreductase [Acetobacteraceae bacterium]|nr:FAD-dependent oxidoreductase [Acetobacteraceae bacterium]